MGPRRLDRLNSLLTEVIADVIQHEMRNPNLPALITVTNVEVTQDLSYAKVYISVMGSAEEKKKAISILQYASGFIRTCASKQVIMRFFPELNFYLDESLEKQLRMEELISKVRTERENRKSQVDE